LKHVQSSLITLNFNRPTGRYTLAIHNKCYEQTMCEFLLTISFLNGKKIEEHLLNTDKAFDTIRIPLTGRGAVLTLDLADFVRLREIYFHEMFLLRLDDMLILRGICSITV